MSKYLQYLPRIFKEGPAAETAFLEKYLEIFQALLARGDDDLQVTGLEQCITQFVTCLDAGLTPVEQDHPIDSPFLSYLAQWVALVFDQNWERLDKKRQWLQRIVPLYKKRGTKSGLLEYLNMFVGRQVEVEEPAHGFIIAESSTISVDTFIAGAPAYYFRVKINYGFDESFEIDVWKNLRKGIKSIVDLEKPAHTYYNLDARTPGIIVAERSTVSKDTLIWKESKKI
jgi:phage tail-like protein